jgi:hypothetical protein
VSQCGIVVYIQKISEGKRRTMETQNNMKKYNLQNILKKIKK